MEALGVRRHHPDTRLKILHTVQLYEPHKGGSEEVVRQISERLAARGHEVTVATGYDPHRRFDKLNGVEVVSFDVSGNLVAGIRGDVEKYKRFVRGFQCDVLLNYAAQIWSTDLCFELLEDLDAAKVMVPCGYLLGAPEFAAYYAGLPKHLSKYDALVYMSRSYQDFRFGEENGMEDKAVVIPNGASAEEFDAKTPSFKQRYGIKTPLMVLNVANHYDLKGHKRIIKAFKALDRDDVTLVIVGENPGPIWTGCLKYCLAHSIVDRRIKVLSGVERSLVVSAYKDADVFVLASDVECAPLVIYEAMAAATPFVSTDCGNVRDNDAAGIVVDYPEKLGDSIETLLRDEGLRRSLGEAGHRQWKEGHTWDRISAEYERLYLRILKSRR